MSVVDKKITLIISTRALAPPDRKRTFFDMENGLSACLGPGRPINLSLYIKKLPWRTNNQDVQQWAAALLLVLHWWLCNK
jgi:hypothetical protein